MCVCAHTIHDDVEVKYEGTTHSFNAGERKNKISVRKMCKTKSESKKMNPLNYLKHTIMNIEMSCKSACRTHATNIYITANASAAFPVKSVDEKRWGERRWRGKKNHHWQPARKNDSFRWQATEQRSQTVNCLHTQIYTSSGISSVKVRWTKIEILFFRSAFNFKIDDIRFFRFACPCWVLHIEDAFNTITMVQYARMFLGDPVCWVLTTRNTSCRMILRDINRSDEVLTICFVEPLTHTRANTHHKSSRIDAKRNSASTAQAKCARDRHEGNDMHIGELKMYGTAGNECVYAANRHQKRAQIRRSWRMRRGRRRRKKKKWTSD